MARVKMMINVQQEDGGNVGYTDQNFQKKGVDIIEKNREKK
jgi:alanine dehydrogenase